MEKLRSETTQVHPEKDAVTVAIEKLADGLCVATVKTSGEGTVRQVGRDTQEAVAEAWTNLEALRKGTKYTPRACIFSPHRDC